MRFDIANGYHKKNIVTMIEESIGMCEPCFIWARIYFCTKR